MNENSQEIFQEDESYEIRIQGYLEDRWTDWFEGLTIQREEVGTTLLSGRLPDQTALHGVLLKIRDMNLKILSVRQLGPEEFGQQP